MNAQDNEMLDRRHPVEEDIALQRRIWRIERIGWYVLLVVVVLTLCGLFSHGLLSSAVASSKTKDVVVEYERYHRSGAVNTMVIHTRGKPREVHTVVIGKSMMEGFSIDSIQPQPKSSSGNEQGLRLTMEGDAHGESSLYLGWTSNGLGLYHSKIAVEGGGEVSITQFIYP